MQIHVLPTNKLYRRMLAAPNHDAAQAIYTDEILAAFPTTFLRFGGDDIVQTAAQWGMLDAEGLPGAVAALDALETADAWVRAESAMVQAAAQFPNASFDSVTVGILLADINRNDPNNRGYTGFGAFAGEVMAVYSQPNDYNLSRLEGLVAHEFHHNVRFTVHPFDMMNTSVGDYIVHEGLAESFATEQFGAEHVGFFVEDQTEDTLATARALIADHLTDSGFNVVRPYIFGDWAVEMMPGTEPVGMPNFGGYAIGYHVVQAYLQRTGCTVAEATQVGGEEIIRESGYFG